VSAVVTKDVLGRLPSEIRLAGWQGPTLFSSEARDGQLVALATYSAPLREHAHAESLVVGTMRETQGPTPTAYAAFCVDPRTGDVVLVDLEAAYRVRFVNSGLEEFVASLAVFVSAWPRLAAAEDSAVKSVLDRLRSELAAIDAAALSDDDAFWPTSLETYS
jgi:hypothetical protein